MSERLSYEERNRVEELASEIDKDKFGCERIYAHDDGSIMIEFIQQEIEQELQTFMMNRGYAVADMESLNPDDLENAFGSEISLKVTYKQVIDL